MSEPVTLVEPDRPAVVDALWTPLVRHGSTWCAPNVHAEATWLHVGGERWPAALTTMTRRNSYVVSATGQYLDYALEETRRVPGAVSRTAGRVLLHALGPMLRALDPILVLDALPVSTVLHGARTPAEWEAAVSAARARWPQVPRVVRSLDAVTGAPTIDALCALGLQLMPSRLVFHQDPRTDAFWRARNLRHDRALLHDAPMEHRALRASDAADVQRLYWQLYGDKHSTLNPDFTATWIAHAMEAGVFTGHGVLHEGRLVAAYLSYRVQGVMTNPVFGYDTTLPQSLGLYRRLSVLALEEAQRRNCLLHASSGAPGFKASRGGVPALEWHAVDLHGVRGAPRAAWESALRIARAVGPAMLRRAT